MSTTPSNNPTPSQTFISLLTHSADPSSLPSFPVANMAYDNKNNILTQSLMLKTEDSDKFFACQPDEIKGLYDPDIIEIRHISNLPPRAKLLSSIWSYHRKWLPNGILFKYKSHLSINGKDQALGRDYWETYAHVASWSTIRLLILYLPYLIYIQGKLSTLLLFSKLL